MELILQTCELCHPEGEELVWENSKLRVIRASEPGFPAFYRVIWNQHIAELSDLSAADRAYCIDVVCAVEQSLRQVLLPTKINLASLGNMVPHLHWHIIARFEWDSHFPNPVWAPAVRASDIDKLSQIEQLQTEVITKIQTSLDEI